MRRVSATDTLQDWEGGEVLLLDVRGGTPPEHIPGDAHLPLSRLEQHDPQLPRGKRVVAY